MPRTHLIKQDATIYSLVREGEGIGEVVIRRHPLSRVVELTTWSTGGRWKNRKTQVVTHEAILSIAEAITNGADDAESR